MKYSKFWHEQADKTYMLSLGLLLGVIFAKDLNILIPLLLMSISGIISLVFNEMEKNANVKK